MKLLISPANVKEAAEAIAGGADIIDVKNPQEGALGANFPWVIKQIRELAPKNVRVSCALGDVPNLPGSVSLAALGAATLGVDYIKVGLCGCNTAGEAVYLLRNVNKAAKGCNPKIKVAAVGLADTQRIDSLDPMQIPSIAFKARVEVAMLDTGVKDGKNLFSYLKDTQLEEFVDCSHQFGLEVALAGSLRKQDLPVIYRFGADIAGLRGAACTNSDRVRGEIKRALVEELVETIKQAEGQAGKVRV
ncbi:MAG: (5-formylfuran-3-yl)methyl phosphate synthase [Candidatus Bathyarchaeia archaeon]